MLRTLVFFLSVIFLGSCGSNSSTPGKYATQAATGISGVFSGNGQSRAVEDMRAELEKTAWVVRFRAAFRPEFTLTCAMVTGQNFCASGGKSLDPAESGGQAVVCSQTASGNDCDVNCDGIGKKIKIPCGSAEIIFGDPIFQGTFAKPTCTETRGTISITICMKVKKMEASITYGTLKGEKLICGKTDGTEDICQTIKMSSTISLASPTPSSTPDSSQSDITCKLDGADITMDFAGGSCG